MRLCVFCHEINLRPRARYCSVRCNNKHYEINNKDKIKQKKRVSFVESGKNAERLAKKRQNPEYKIYEYNLHRTPEYREKKRLAWHKRNYREFYEASDLLSKIENLLTTKKQEKTL